MPDAAAAPQSETASGSLDGRRREVLERVAAAEHAFVLAGAGDGPLDPERRRRVEATCAEMVAQPAVIRQALPQHRRGLAALAERLSGRVDRVLLTGAGDSLAVMVAARSALEAALGVPCEPVQSLELAYYLAPLVGPRTAVVALSSSGETTRTVEAVMVARAQGSYTVCLTNTAGSTLAREADASLLVAATRVGWPTQSSTAPLALLYALAAAIGERTGRATGLGAELARLPDVMGEVLDRLDGPVAAIAAREVGSAMVLFSAGGPTFAAAVIGAAKVMECTPGRAQAVQVEEYHHYNSQKAGEPLFLLAPTGPTVSRAADTAAEARRWGGRVHVVTTEGEDRFDGLADTVLRVPPVAEALAPLLYVLPAQLVGYHLGMAGFAAAEAGRG